MGNTPDIGGPEAESTVSSLAQALGPLAGVSLALAAYRQGKIGKVAAGASLATSAYTIGKAIRDRIDAEIERRSYTISVSEDDDVYFLAQRYVMSLVPEKDRRAINAYTFHRNDRGHSREAARELSKIGHRAVGKSSYELLPMYDSERAATVEIGGHKIQVAVEKPNANPFAGLAGGGAVKGNLLKPPKLVFSARNSAGRDAVLDMLLKLTDELESAQDSPQKSRLFVATTWGDFTIVKSKPRPLETVILDDGLVEDMLEDMGRFLNSEDRYTELGLPWHRGYLLHGPPGTGKTSIAKALAHYFETDLYYLPIADVQKDNDFAGFMRAIGDRGILLLEDVDILHATGERDHDKVDGLSLAGLLNALDGVITPHGMITIMTTNDLDSLDPALRRAGRSDRLFQITYLTHSQTVRVCELISGRKVDPSDVPPVGDNLTPAELLEASKTHLDNPEEALKAVIEYLRMRESVDA